MNFPVHDLAENGDTAEMQLLLSNYPELLETKDDFGNAPLHYACWNKHVETVKLLISLGANPNRIGEHTQTPLHCAVLDGDDDVTYPIAKILLDAGANINAKDMSGKTAIDHAKIQSFALKDTKLFFQTLDSSGGTC